MQFMREKTARDLRVYIFTTYEFRCHIFKSVGNLNLIFLFFKDVFVYNIEMEDNQV